MKNKTKNKTPQCILHSAFAVFIRHFHTIPSSARISVYAAMVIRQLIPLESNFFLAVSEELIWIKLLLRQHK